ncbi:MAG: cysteine desulfurase, partial [Chloroflexi bacterium]|nr:cysteine desulfurase [Chloroflexota bacterium]
MWGEAIYLDNAAATRLDERVLEAMKPYLFETYAVATSEFGYSLGIEAREALEGARAAIAETLGAAAEEVIFTSGGAESSTLALKGVAAALGAKKGRHIVTTKLEDFPVLHSAQALERQGFEATYLEVDADGRLDPQRLREALRPDTVLVSVQAANQEIGTLQEIPTLAQVAHERGVLFHTDATHSYRRIPLDVQEAPVDLVTLSAHTLHGPKGVGALYVRKGTPLTRQVEGGFQELGLRGGLENIPGAVGFAEAARLATADETARLQGLRDRLTAGLLQIPHSRVNGHPVHRLPHNANISFRFVEGESVLLHLDMRGIAVSTGSACFSHSLEASHV